MLRISDDKVFLISSQLKNVTDQLIDDKLTDNELLSEQPVREKKNQLPKRVGIVFVEEFPEELPKKSRFNTIIKERNRFKIKLNFDQLVFAHLFLQLNKCQSLFDFQIVSPSKSNGFDLPKKPGTDILNWFIEQIEKFEERVGKKRNNYGIDHWISITSEELWEDNLFCQGRLAGNKLIWVITSHDWEKKYCPPSLFEYLISLIIMCCLNNLSHDYNGSLHQHIVDTTSGCIFENTQLKTYRRISVSNPLLCFSCKEQIQYLDETIKHTTGISLYDEVEKILSKEWMGNLEKRDSPIYNLKKNYKYNIDRNSGFYKTTSEKFRDNIEENLPEWIVGTIITATIGGILAIVGKFLAIF